MFLFYEAMGGFYNEKVSLLVALCNYAACQCGIGISNPWNEYFMKFNVSEGEIGDYNYFTRIKAYYWKKLTNAPFTGVYVIE